MKKIALLFTLLALCACAQGQTESNTNLKEAVRFEAEKSHEWVSFDVYRSRLNRRSKTQWRNMLGRVCVHNVSDSVQHIAFFRRDVSCLVRPDSALYLDHYHWDLVRYASDAPRNRQGNTWYEEVLIEMLQGELNYFPMYADAYPEVSGQVSYPDDPARYCDAGSHIRVEASIVEKYCYADHCELVDNPITLFYNRSTQLFDSAYVRNGKAYDVLTLSEFSFSDASSLIDSVFDLARYPHYDRTPSDNFIPSRLATANTRMNDTLLHYPLVNLTTGDTLSLADLDGWTLLYFNWFSSGDYYRTLHRYAKEVDHIVWLEPSSNNLPRLRQIAEAQHYGNDTYYTKGFRTQLNELKGVYLISPDHQIAGYVGHNWTPYPKLFLRALLAKKHRQLSNCSTGCCKVF